MVYFIVGYLLVAVLVSAFAVDRRISVGEAFTISFFLTPVMGLLAILKSGKKIKITHYINNYHCPRCNTEYKSDKDYCPYCLSEGVKIKPEKTMSIMKLAI